MNKKLYKRDGRRFVPVEDLTGQIKEVEGTKAICVLQTTTERYWAEIDDSGEYMSHNAALNYVKTRFNGKGILPTRSLLLLLRDKYKEKICSNWSYWTADIYENKPTDAWTIAWHSGNLYCSDRHRLGLFSAIARAFFIENI